MAGKLRLLRAVCYYSVVGRAKGKTNSDAITGTG